MGEVDPAVARVAVLDSAMGDGETPSVIAKRGVCGELLLLPHLPYLFGGPLPRPVERDERVGRFRAGRWLDLDQVFDVESRAAHEPDPLAVCEMELHPGVARPFHARHAEGRTEQAVG